LLLPKNQAELVKHLAQFWIGTTSKSGSVFGRRQQLVDRTVVEPLLLGFVEDVEAISKAADTDVTGYFVTLPSDMPKHAQASHGYDGNGQRPPIPADYDNVAKVLNDSDKLRAGDKSRNGNATVVATKQIEGETYRAVFEVLTGKKNRALALLSLVVKTQK
jgi:hypothetical protein